MLVTDGRGEDLIIRRATKEDLAATMEVIRKVVPAMRAAGNLQWDVDYPNPEILAGDIEQGQLWVAESHEHGIVGLAAFTTEQEPEYGQLDWDVSEAAIVTHRLAVDPEFRGQGVALALLDQAETVAREGGVRSLRIDTNSENMATQRLFPKLGYVLVGEIELSFREGTRFLCYEKRLD